MIPEEEIEIDTWRKDRANVNMPDNCVRATHIPTGKFVDESESRFYWQNYDRAIKRLNELVFPEMEMEIENYVLAGIESGFRNIGIGNPVFEMKVIGPVVNKGSVIRWGDNQDYVEILSSEPVLGAPWEGTGMPQALSCKLHTSNPQVFNPAALFGARNVHFTNPNAPHILPEKKYKDISELVSPEKAEKPSITERLEKKFEEWMLAQGFIKDTLLIEGSVWIFHARVLTKKEVADKLMEWSRLTIVE